ncbi:MAG: hypothetical protein M3R25_12035 [Bacteroidota bacterium]|nr:hypothetical protein [Bacteroidota bacterium]
MRSIHIVLIIVTLLACKRSDTIEESALYGKWDIVKAERNGKETHYLRGGYFVIGDDGTIAVNITGEEEKGEYILDQQNLQMDEDKIFSIESLQNDTLIVKYLAASNGQFVFYMARGK